LLADKVGLVKTLSLVTCALISLGDDPTLILCLATLTLQWQAELLDKLGIPSAVWSSAKQRWIDHLWHDIRTRGPEDIAKQIAIVSTGLIFHDSEERRHLLGHRHGMGMVVLDEARQREALDNEEGLDLLADLLSRLIKEEAGFFSEELSRLEAHDLKLGAVKYFLTEHCSEGRTSMDALSLLRHGFSLELSAAIPGELIAVYAGADESSIVRDGGFSAVEREAIKAAVRRRDIRLLVATGRGVQPADAWDADQRRSAVEPFAAGAAIWPHLGQGRLEVDMLNLVCHDAQDEKIYAAHEGSLSASCPM
jgi:hypothetical protein